MTQGTASEHLSGAQIVSGIPKANHVSDILGDTNAIRRFAEQADQLTKHLIEGLPHITNPAEFNDYWDGHHELLLKFSEHLGVSHAPGSSNEFIPQTLAEQRKAVNDFMEAVRSSGANLPDVVDRLADVLERINTLVNNYPIILQISRQQNLVELGNSKIDGIDVDAKMRAREETIGDLVIIEGGSTVIRARGVEAQVDTAATSLVEVQNRNIVARELSAVQTDNNLAVLQAERLAGEARTAQALAIAGEALARAHEAEQNTQVLARAIATSAPRFAALDMAAQDVAVSTTRVRLLGEQKAVDQREREIIVKDRRHYHWSRRSKYAGIAMAAASLVVVSNTVADNPSSSHYGNSVFQAVNNGWDDVYNPLADHLPWRADEKAAQADFDRRVAAARYRTENNIPTPEGEGLEIGDRILVASRPVNGERLMFQCRDGVVEPVAPPIEPENIAAATEFSADPCTILPGTATVLINSQTGKEYRLTGIEAR